MELNKLSKLEKLQLAEYLDDLINFHSVIVADEMGSEIDPNLFKEQELTGTNFVLVYHKKKIDLYHQEYHLGNISLSSYLDDLLVLKEKYPLSKYKKKVKQFIKSVHEQSTNKEVQLNNLTKHLGIEVPDESTLKFEREHILDNVTPRLVLDEIFKKIDFERKLQKLATNKQNSYLFIRSTVDKLYKWELSLLVLYCVLTVSFGNSITLLTANMIFILWLLSTIVVSYFGMKFEFIEDFFLHTPPVSVTDLDWNGRRINIEERFRRFYLKNRFVRFSNKYSKNFLFTEIDTVREKLNLKLFQCVYYSLRAEHEELIKGTQNYFDYKMVVELLENKKD